MHWEEHCFAMPKLPKDLEWTYCLDTDAMDAGAYPIQLDDNGNKQVSVPARTVLVIRSTRKKPDRKKQVKKK